MNGKLEKIMRILTLPPLVAILTAALLWLGAGMTGGEFAAAALLLGLVPLLAYPLWEIFPNKEDRRSGQRTYALYCSVAGYAAGFLWSQLGVHSPEVQVLFSSYIVSVIILTLLSKLAGFKAFALRSYVSTAMAQLVDNLIFTTLVSKIFFGWTWTQVLVCALIQAAWELLCEVLFSGIGYKVVCSWEQEQVGQDYLSRRGEQTA